MRSGSLVTDVLMMIIWTLHQPTAQSPNHTQARAGIVFRAKEMVLQSKVLLPRDWFCRLKHTVHT